MKLVFLISFFLKYLKNYNCQLKITNILTFLYILYFAKNLQNEFGIQLLHHHNSQNVNPSNMNSTLYHHHCNLELWYLNNHGEKHACKHCFHHNCHHKFFYIQSMQWLKKKSSINIFYEIMIPFLLNVVLNIQNCSLTYRIDVI